MSARQMYIIIIIIEHVPLEGGFKREGDTGARNQSVPVPRHTYVCGVPLV